MSGSYTMQNATLENLNFAEVAPLYNFKYPAITQNLQKNYKESKKNYFIFDQVRNIRSY